jgi:hypothetical protein
MSNVCAEYSGVVIDQNVVTEALAPNSNWYFQTFRLPENYLRGTKSGQTRFPGISGFQLLAEIEKETAATVTLNYTIEQHNFGNTEWEVLAKGTVTGAQAEGERVWIDVVLGEEIPVDISMTTNVSELRIGFQVVSGIEKLYYAQPNPLPGFVEALQSDGKALLAPPASFAFRLLGLIADSGTDFLDDPYRSAVIRSEAEAPVGENTNAGFWLSAPQPSKFAVTSHYSDLRVFPTTPTYGVINTLLNPSFEYDVVNDKPFGWSITPPTKESAPVKEENTGIVTVRMHNVSLITKPAKWNINTEPGLPIFSGQSKEYEDSEKNHYVLTVVSVIPPLPPGTKTISGLADTPISGDPSMEVFTVGTPKIQEVDVNAGSEGETFESTFAYEAFI